MTKAASLSQLERQYARLRAKLSQAGYLSQGSVQDRTSRPGGGAGYQWTRKVAGRTVTVALTSEQYEEMKDAVANKRQLGSIISQLEKLSRKIIFQSHPHPRRHKRLTKKVLGLN